MDLNIALNISAPDLCSALNNLASAIASKAVAAPAAPAAVPVTEAVAEEKPAATKKPAAKKASTSKAKKTEEAPVAAPTAAPTAPVSAPVQTAPTAPVAAPAAAPVAPVAAPVAAPAAPAKPAITMADISRAGAALVEEVGIPPLQEVIAKYGVRSIQELDPSTYESFAADLRALGARI